MDADSTRKRVSDPEMHGLPDTADDDSTAFVETESARPADGPDPAALPLDRDDAPLGLDHHGITTDEARAGEPLEVKLARETSDRDDGPEDSGGPSAEESSLHVIPEE